MSKKSVRRSSIGLSILALLAIGWAIFRNRLSPTDSIKAAFKGTKYERLTPYVIAQAKHETGNFDPALSAPFRENNNMFGMGRPRSRNTLDTKSDLMNPLITEGQAMAKFKNYRDSAKDLILWMDMFRSRPFPTNVQDSRQYAKALKDRGYYTDSLDNYTNGLNRWL